MLVAVLLAAGGSRRWGAGNKLFAPIGGETMLARSCRAALAVGPHRLVVVTGWQSARVARAVRRIAPRATIARAADHREGLGASLRAAHRALRRSVDRAVLLFLADMPWVVAGGIAGRRGAIVRPCWRGVPGHPVLVRGPVIRALATARGDAGPFRAYRTTWIAGDRRCVADVDRPAQLRSIPPRLR